MGLFFTNTGATQRTGKPQPRKSISIHQLDHTKLGCSQCPRDKGKMHTPKMMPLGARNPLVYILGEQPTVTDDDIGRPWQGASGEAVRRLIPEKHDSSLRWHTVLRCRGGKPEPLDLACCRGHIEGDIAAAKPLIVIAFGDAIEWALGPGRSAYGWRGRRVPVTFAGHTCWVYPITHPAALHYNKDKKKDDAIRRCFEHDVQRVFRDLEAGLPEPTVAAKEDWAAGIVSVTDYGMDGLKQIEDFIAKLSEADTGVDIETNMLRPYSAESRVLSVAVSNFEETLAFGWNHAEARWGGRHKNLLRDIIGAYVLDDRAMKWAHRAAFEQEWFHAIYGAGAVYEARWGDTLGQAHVLDERPGKELDDLTQLHFGFRIKSLSDVDVKNMAAEPLRKILPYNGMDAKWCHGLSVVQADLLAAQGLQEVYEERNAATASIVRMQAKGMVRNPPAIADLDKQFTAEEEKLRAGIVAHKDAKAFAQHQGKEFNPGSNPQLAALFYDFLKLKAGGKRGKERSVDEDALTKLRHPIAASLLQLRAVDKVHDYVIPLKEGGKYVHGDGLVHPSYSQFITASGRLAASEPNSQNYPRRKNKTVRRVIGCPPGHRCVAFDYGQLEARIVACIANDPVLQAEIRNKQDIHGDWTDKIGRRFIEPKWKSDRKGVRDSIKQYWTFANFYGNVLEAVAYDLGREFGIRIDPNQLAPYFDEFWDRYKATYQWQQRLLDTYNREGFAATATGQRRREPMSRNELINHPIQGTAGHLVIDAQARIDRLAYEQELDILTPFLNVHDDLSFYVPDEGLEDFIPLVAEHMVCTPFDFITVPLSVEVKVSTGGKWGHNWADLEEIAVFETRDFR